MRAILAVVLVTACRSPSAPPFTLRIAVSGPLAPMSPEAELRSWTRIVQPCVFDTLLDLGPNGESVPVLAAKVEVAGRGLRVWLRSDAQFSDGTTVTFKDVADSLAASGLRATPEGTAILVTGEGATEPIELLLARTFIFKRAGERVVGTGPFVVAEQDATHLLLVRMRPEPGLIAHVELDSYATPQDTFVRTLKGDADLLIEVQPRWVELLQGVPRLRILQAPGTHANMIAFNPARLSRAERVALAHALAGDDIRRVAFGDDCAPPERRPGVEPLPPGPPLQVLTLPFLDRFALAVRRALAERGDAVRTVEIQDFFAAISRRDFDLVTIRPPVWPPMTVAYWRTGGESAKVLGYSNPVVDAAIDARDWAGAQRALEDDPPGVAVCTQPSVVVLDARVRTPPLSAGFRRSLPRWEVAQ